MSETNCSVHEICMWELALEGAKRNAETAIHRMEKAESELTKLRKRVEVLLDAVQFTRDYCVCERFKTKGFDYGEEHKRMGKPKEGARWITPQDKAKFALAESAKIAEGK